MRGIRDSGSGFWFFGLALVVVGYFGPWVPHDTAALTVTGFELAEFAKFFPQVQGGVAHITRTLFYLPFVTILILLALFASRSAVRSVRLVVPLLAAVLLVVALLPYSVVSGVRHVLTTRAPLVLDPQYTGQLVLVVVGTALTLLTVLARWFPRRIQATLVVLLVLVGVIPALWQFVLLRPLVVALYDAPLGLGWGMIVCVAGFALLLLSDVLAPQNTEIF
ncbi:MAG: hypothetical protein SXV54_05920 [Chloroflexota bacterium]|nr:hypothetical protein [Chloroflexota bacterium]